MLSIPRIYSSFRSWIQALEALVYFCTATKSSFISSKLSKAILNLSKLFVISRPKLASTIASCWLNSASLSLASCWSFIVKKLFASLKSLLKNSSGTCFRSFFSYLLELELDLFKLYAISAITLSLFSISSALFPDDGFLFSSCSACNSMLGMKGSPYSLAFLIA